MMHLRPSLAGAVVALLAAPAAASASPTVTLDKKCFVSASPDAREPVSIHGHYFMPKALIDVYIDNTFQAPTDAANPPTADANGDLEGSVSAPFVASGQQFFTLRLAEHNGNPDGVVEVRAKVTALSVTSSPVTPRTTSSSVRFRGRGFTNPLNPIYAHYVLGDKVRQTIQIGKPFGDCGQFSVRRKQFPMKNPRTGTWYVQFDQEATYNPKAPVYTRLKIKVTKHPRPRS
jgi:hypothetical protein